jgi:hypothetical protein
MRQVAACMSLCWLAACWGGGAGPAPPVLSYNGASPFPAVVGQSITLTPAVLGAADHYAVSPALPPGLLINRSTGVISGTPRQASGAMTFMVSARGAGASATFPLVLSVTEPPAALVYDSPVQATVSVALTPLSPKVHGSVDHYDIVPALPPGLLLDPASGVIDGTPRQARILTPYTITASSFAGRTGFTLLLMVKPARSPAVP